MSTVFQLEAKTRTISGKKVKTLREKGLIPAVVYGRGLTSRNLVLAYLPFQKLYKQAGESNLIDLVIDDAAPVKVLIHDISRNPLTDNFSHIDFYQVRMTEKLKTIIPLKFIGEPLAVKELDGVLVKNFDELEVECLPSDLVSEIEVDISSLKTFEDVVRLSNIKIPSGIHLVLKSDEVLAKVMPPRSEEEIKATEEKAEEKVAEVKVIREEEKKKKEEEVLTEEKAGKEEKQPSPEKGKTK